MQIDRCERTPIRERLLRFARSNGWWPQKPVPYTEDQRQYELNRLVSDLIGSFDNIDVWLIAVKAVSDKRRKAPYLLEKERDQVTEAYQRFSTDLNTPNVPVAELFTASGIADLTKHPLLSKICFNYDGVIGGAEERRRQAWAELEEGKRESVMVDNPDLMSLGRWIEVEFESLGNFRRYNTLTEVVKIFDQQTQTPRYGFAVSNIFGGNDHLTNTLMGIVGHLKPEELLKAVKPESPFFPSHQVRPTIVQ